MIKTFEGFEILTTNNGVNKLDSFEEIYNKFVALRNDSYPIPVIDLKYIPDVFLDSDDWLLLELSEIEGEITEENKYLIIEEYKKVYEKYKLYKMPDYEDVANYFLSLNDMTEVELTLLIEDHSIKYEVSLIPSVKTFPDFNKIRFDIDEYDDVLMDLIPTVKRLKEKYYVLTFLKPYGKMEIYIYN